MNGIPIRSSLCAVLSAATSISHITAPGCSGTNYTQINQGGCDPRRASRLRRVSGFLLNHTVLTRLSAFCLSASDVLGLDGSSGLVYRVSPAPRRTSGDVVSLKFKTLRNSGTLLHLEGEQGLGISLELERGKLQLLLRRGTAHRILFTPAHNIRYIRESHRCHAARLCHFFSASVK